MNNFVSAATTSANSTISMASNVTAKLHSAEIMTQDKAKIAAITIEITNNSSNSLSLIDYWAKIKSKSGKSYQTKLKESDKTKERVQAKSSTYLTYYATVDSTIKYSDLSVEVIKWDFSATNYERVLGTLKTQANSSGEVSAYSTKSVLYTGGSLKIGLKQNMLYTDESSAHLTLNVLIENESASGNALSNLRMYVQSDDNKLYALDMNSLSTKTMTANESSVYSVQATIPKSELNHKYSLILASYEESSKINLPIGMFALPKLSVTAPTQINKEKLTYIDGKPIKATVSESQVSLVENKENLITTVSLENTSTSKIAVSNLEFFVKTKDGYLYPLAKLDDTTITLLPKIKQSIDIQGQIPNQSILSSSEIVMMSTTENAASAYLGNFVIKTGITQETSGPEAIYNGYKIKQTSLNRIPLDLTDLIVAEFALTNNTAVAKSKLNIQGYFKIDGVKLDASTAKVVVLDELSTIGPNQTYNILAYMEVPYNQVTNKIEFVMQESTGQQSSKSIYQFTQNALSKPVDVTSNKGYEITSLGKRANIKFVKSNVYKGTTTDFFYAELEYTNKEQRAINPARLAGYIENQDGSIINVQLSDYKERVLPNGKVIISAWVQMPRGFEENKIKFFFGEAFTLNETTNAVVRPVLANVQVKEIDVKKEFTGLAISNYSLDIRNMYISVNLPDGLNADGINLTFDYDLLKNESVYPNAEDQKLMIEFIDQSKNKLTYTKELAFDSKELKDDTLMVGKEMKKTIKFDELGLYFKTDMKDVTINIYSVFQGNRMLLATRDITWFTKTP